MAARELRNRIVRCAAGCCVLAVMAVSGPSEAALIEEREVSIRIQGEVFLREDSVLVRLEEPGDVEAWQSYPIHLNDHVELVSSTAEVIDADGAVIDKVRRREHQRVDSPGAELFTSNWLSIIPFPPLRVGQMVRIRYERRWKPLFRATSVGLVMDSGQQKLRVKVTGGGASFRWSLTADDDRFSLVPSAGGVTLEGRDIPALDPPEYAPAYDLSSPMLLVAWGSEREWADVGSWYDRLAPAPPPSPAMTALVNELCGDSEGPRACLEAVASYVKTQVRYEAVEIGDGGWVPTSPSEVLARGWGDCKDKSQLLRGLLAAAEIPAHLVLIRSGLSGNVDPAFPWPYSFNHCVVAVNEGSAGATDGDPVGGGYLLVDPTADLGGVRWLPPRCQDRPALIVNGDQSVLVDVPARADDEQRHLVVRGGIHSNGTLDGTVALTLRGSRAVGWIRGQRSEAAERIVEDVIHYFTALFPGAVVADVGWTKLESVVPGFYMEARLRVPNVGQGSAGRRSVTPLGLGGILEPRILDERSVPVVVRLGDHHTQWEVALPDGWCPPVARSEGVENALGRFDLTVGSGEGQTLVFDRRVQLRRGLVAEEGFTSLREIAIAENRATKRRLRLRCPSS